MILSDFAEKISGGMRNEGLVLGVEKALLFLRNCASAGAAAAGWYGVPRVTEPRKCPGWRKFAPESEITAL